MFSPNWTAQLFCMFSLKLLTFLSLPRWGGVMVVGSRATWPRSCSVWVQSVISAICPACCSTATSILRQVSKPAIMVLEWAHTHQRINCVITLLFQMILSTKYSLSIWQNCISHNFLVTETKIGWFLQHHQRIVLWEYLIKCSKLHNMSSDLKMYLCKT